MSADGVWDITMQTPMGNRDWTLTLSSAGESVTGTIAGEMGTTEITNGRIQGTELSWTFDSPRGPIEYSTTIDGDEFSGTANLVGMEPMTVTGTRRS